MVFGINCEKKLLEEPDDVASLYELQGIIAEIVCGGTVNTKEVLKLHQWMKRKEDSIRRYVTNKEILNRIEDILANGVITKEEQSQLLKLLNNRIDDVQIKTKLNHMRRLVKERKNIGLDLIDILDNEKAKDLIHKQAIRQLESALQFYSGIVKDSEIVFISLCLIGMQEYDGNFYDSVQKTYAKLYQRDSKQKIEGIIRTILNGYCTDKKNQKGKPRIINIVLSNAIVPVHYLAAFFEFIFDIYKLNFEYDLPENIQEEFEFVYEGLRDSMLSDSDNIQVNVTKKSYKLIKTTKQLIVDGHLDTVIKLSIIIVRLIDKHVWDKEVTISNSYLKTGYVTWANSLPDDAGKKQRRKTPEIRSRWEPKLKLLQNDIYLEAPIHRIKLQYDYRRIFVLIKNGEKIIYRNDRPYIREIIGGFQVTVDAVKLEEPLGEIIYLLMADQEVIYSSKERLHRDYIVFDEKGDELQNNNDYKGTAVICTTVDELPEKVYFKSEYYRLEVMSVSYEDTIPIGTELFSFSSLIKPGIFGNEIPHQYLRREGTDDLIPVYSMIKFLTFECVNDTEKFEICLNDRSFRLSDFHYTRTKKQASWKFVVDMIFDKPGIYNLDVCEIHEGRKNRIATFQFGYDPAFEMDQYQIDDNIYMVSVCSALCSEIIKKKLDIRNFDENWLQIESNGLFYTYFVLLNIHIYRIQGQEWRPVSEPLWIGDIAQDSVMEFYGCRTEGLLICSNFGSLLQEEVSTKAKGVHTEIYVGFLQSYKESYDFVTLILLNSGKAYATLPCYNRCVFHKESTEINFNSTTRILTVLPHFDGKGNIIFEITDKDGVLIYKESQVGSGVSFEVDGLQSFIDYNFHFYEKPKGLMVKKIRNLMIISKKFYAREDFVGRFFKIKEVQYDQAVRGEFLRKTHYFRNVYIYFLNRISNDVFQGNIVVKTAIKSFELYNINPVEIEICGDVVDDELELSMTKDGDGLLLDFKHHGIMNTMESDKAVDIFSYTIDANGEETLWKN